MDVSIVINNYNYEEYIGDAIESAITQRYESTEVIVVDDGSTDRSREVIEGYKEDIRPVYKKNGGQASALNTGFELSTGELILFLDSDDYLERDAVEQAVSVWQSGVAKVQYRLQCVDEHGEPLGDLVKPRWDESFPSGHVENQIREKGGYVTAPTSGNLFNRNALQNIFPIPPKKWQICADAYLDLSAPFYGKVRSIDSVLGYYRIHGKNEWQASSLEPDTLSRRVQVHLRKQELVIDLLENNFGGGITYFPNLNFARDRFATFFLFSENHPIPDDSRIDAISYGVWSALVSDNANLLRRFRHILGYIFIGIMPKFVARPIIKYIFL